MIPFCPGDDAIIVRSGFVYVGISLVNYGVGMIDVVGSVVHGANSFSDIGLSYASPHAGMELNIASALNVVEGIGVQRLVAETGVTLSQGL